jgi:hypothetical protein
VVVTNTLGRIVTFILLYLAAGVLSCDGRTVIAVAGRGARALGVEYNPDLVELSQRRAKDAGVSERAAFVQGDMRLSSGDTEYIGSVPVDRVEGRATTGGRQTPWAARRIQ